jgi:alpha-tubulin suppressor-like RCC1 family protein
MTRVPQRRILLTLFALGGVACNALFGLDEVTVRDDAGAAAGAGTGGSVAGSAGQSSGGSAGIAGAASGGTSGVAGTSSGGSAGSGGSSGAAVEILLDMSATHVCAARDGSIKCWGKNDEGQLNGVASNNVIGDAPGEMGAALGTVDLGGAAVAGIAVGERHTCALTEQAGVRCWGSPYNGLLGFGSRIVDVDLGTNAAVKTIGAGGFYTCAELASGSVKCWGSNAKLQLGQTHTNTLGDDAGEMGNALVPLDFGTGTSVLGVAPGYDFACARLTDASGPHVHCWGSNDESQLGVAPPPNSLALANSPSLLDAQPLLAIATGRWHACAIHADEQMSCWGVNYYGELGAGVTDSRRATPSGVVLGNYKAKAVALGSSHTCAIVEKSGAGRSIKCWGHNLLGQRGVDSKTGVGKSPTELGDALESVKLPDGFVPQQIAAAGHTSCAASTTGEVLCWGSNEFGLLGQGKADASIGGTDGSMATLEPIDLGWP